MDENFANPVPLPEPTPAPELPKKNKVCFIIGVILTALVGLAAVVYSIAITIGLVKLGLSAVCAVQCFRIRRSKKPGNELAGLILLLILAGIPAFTWAPLTIESGARWKYPIQSAYLGGSPDWFPDFSRSVESDYHFSFMPGIMQGTGHFSVSFVTSHEQANAYASEFSQQAVYTVPLRDYSHYSCCYLDEKQTQVLSVYTGRLWAKELSQEQTAVMYILSTNGDWNHPNSSVVIVDPATGRVEFSQLG